MKISCTKENLTQALALVGGVANKNVNLPILGNILIKANEQTIEIVATNLELAVISHLRGVVEAPGSFTVPARTLIDFVNLLSGEKIDLELQENELVVTCGKSATKIKGSSSEEFPVIPAADQGQGFLVEAEELKRGLNQVTPALARNDIRPELAGVFFGFNTPNYAGLVLASTDSYRLAEKKIKTLQGKEEFKIIVPGRTAQEMSRILSAISGETEKNVRLLVSINQLVLNYDGVQMISRLVDGQYPDYGQIIPKEFRTTAKFSAAQMTKEIKAASLFTTTGVNAISFALNSEHGTISVSSTSTQTGEYNSELAGEVTGENNSILLNHRYLLDGLNNIPGDAGVFKMINADSPCLFTAEGDESFLYIVMPIRQ
ncbi:MAG: polymerase III subunit beta protein [Candidatus Magasanikbacteria bacterium GW2011_GWC2_34_16]|uniref:Beta sliding clamp n=2 Tax=Candidatus Magasanikiibacteriota TaxID=1752731 RepID=A0A0G0HCW0_9BACT|nr:MAG: polymerase III subunit beta protein [Candidatus Magasanikbacteria bacterium GW2011_GWC2_34_16]KKQ41023.1 MAG: polymerase III subunit beta protein [Candidatus Magasanikbacteria bacterium GW2011_GWA2_37_8]